MPRKSTRTPEEKAETQREAVRRYRAKHREELNAKTAAYQRQRRAEDPEWAERSRQWCREARGRHGEQWEARRRADRDADPAMRAADNARRLEHHHANREQANSKRAMNALEARVHTPWRHLLKSASLRATAKDLPFSLTEEWAATRWTGRCEVTDIEFFLKGRGPGPKFFSPSIDQITAKGGYTPENCRFVLWAVNSFKHDATDEDMIRVAHAIARKYPLVSAS